MTWKLIMKGRLFDKLSNNFHADEAEKEVIRYYFDNQIKAFK